MENFRLGKEQKEYSDYTKNDRQLNESKMAENSLMTSVSCLKKKFNLNKLKHGYLNKVANCLNELQRRQ